MAIKWIDNYRTKENKITYDIKCWTRKHNGKESVFIALHNTSAEIVKGLRYVRIGIDENRVYFKVSAKQVQGVYKACDYSSGAFIVTVRADVAPELKAFGGTYSIKIKDNDTFYIDKEN